MGLPIGLVLAGLAWYHYQQLTIPLWRIPVIAVSFVWLVVTLLLAHLYRPKRGPVPNLNVSLVIPSKNEDPTMLRAMLASIDRQTVLPNAVYLIENGDTNGEARLIFNEWAQQTAVRRPKFMYNPNPGKRLAQAMAFAYERDNVPINEKAHVFMTIDGDVQLEPNTTRNGLMPFNDDKVMSVAGLLLGLNRAKNFLTRVVDIGFVSSFVNGRASWSRLNSVAVNCGGLAFYRSWVVWKYLDEYLSQTIMGKLASSGDDRMLTGYCALEGKTVYQETSVAFTLLPVNVSHLGRQRARWWRSFWWGGLWLIRRFSPTRAIWWLVLSQYFTFALYTVMIPLILIVDPILNAQFPWIFFLYISGLSYIRAARTLIVRRPDQSTWDHVLSYILLAPLVTLINLWLCTFLQLWGLVTFYVTGWRTRQKVEVGLQTT
jgi:hyaluronan synthase